MFDRTLVPMQEIHYVSLLSQSGETIMTAPLVLPLEIPQQEKIANLTADINIQLKIELSGKAHR